MDGERSSYFGVDRLHDPGIEMIQRIEYPAESHYVTTPDGYILVMHRIPHGKVNNHITNRPVVFFMHGLVCNSAVWVNMGPEKSLAYLLVDVGFDVWFGNARGNTWSRNHTVLSPKDPRFWKFSWHEIGTIDLPTMIDYILQNTGQKQLFYVGHSQGTTTFFVMASELPEYNDKIKLMIALAPTAYMSNMKHPFIPMLSRFRWILESVVRANSLFEFLPEPNILSQIGKTMCLAGTFFEELCASGLFLIGGWNSRELNATMVPVIVANTPASSSTRQILHYAQEIRSGKFRQYDFGRDNEEMYGTPEPPDYNTRAITAPVALTYSLNDWLVGVEDVKRLESELPNVVLSYEVPDPQFTHLDFVFANDVKKLLYNRLLILLQNYV
ncbi:lysosomal acid lipase-related [Holotrichia oblita]|uniref:Lysosomal acid lipase-related n=1 Tax=Holotrichia oblita TaxID=644536 RepID=A0ACB9TAL6_HOLOL|nr:lysosomal acid lipase-related [Holotrichia oblita]